MISKELQGQIDRLKNTGAFALSMPLKKELKELCKEYGVETDLSNLSCGVCLRNAMYNLSRHIERYDDKPVLQMKMVKDLDNMTYQELKAHAKDKGIKAGRVKKEELIEIIKNGTED